MKTSHFNSFEALSDYVPFKMILTFLDERLSLVVKVRRLSDDKTLFIFKSHVTCSRGEVYLPGFEFTASSFCKDELCLFLSDCHFSSLIVYFE